MSKKQKHNIEAVFDPLDPSAGEIDDAKEMLIEREEGFSGDHKRLEKKTYEKELAKLQSELVKMQYWVKATGFHMIILFEGRDAAGQGRIDQTAHGALEPQGMPGGGPEHAFRTSEKPVVFPALRGALPQRR